METTTPAQVQSPWKDKAVSPPQPWITPRSWVCMALAAAIVLCFGASLLASDTSYAVWAAGGIAGTILTLVSPIVGLALLIVELKDQHRQAALWPALLLGTCVLPLLMIFLGGLFFP